MDWEVENKVIELDGGNNSSLLDSSFKGKWQYKYYSTGRAISMMWRLCKFVAAIFENLTQTDKSLVQCCQDAYTDTLSMHHGWLIRNGAGLAMNFAGSRESLIKAMGLSSAAEAEPVYPCFVEVRDQLE